MPSVTGRTFFKEDSIRKRAEQIFNLPANAGEKEVKNAYRRLVAKHHPDRNPHDTLSKQKMQLILQAYEVLTNKLAYGGILN
jgi:DnaJ-class molecular chaperone